MLPARHNNWMPDIFNDFFDTNWMDRPKATAPAINVIETPEAYELELAAKTSMSIWTRKATW